MFTKERDIVLRGRDGGEDTIDLPITRLGNVESRAEEKEAPEQGDYIPVIDAADSENMKKFPAQWLMDRATGAGCGTGELDLESSRIGGGSLSLYVPGEGEEKLTEGEGYVELVADAAEEVFERDEGEAWILGGLELRIRKDGSGRRWGRIIPEGTTEAWMEPVTGEPEIRMWPVTVTVTEEDRDGGIAPISKGALLETARSAVIKLAVRREDGKVGKKYAILVRDVAKGFTFLQSISPENDDTYLSLGYDEKLYVRAEITRKEGGEPLTLSMEEATARYGEMERIAARHDPCLSCGMTEIEKRYFYDNGDPETGKPIRRNVFRVNMCRTGLESSMGLTMRMNKTARRPWASIYIPGTMEAKKGQSFLSNYVKLAVTGGTAENSPVRGNLAVLGTEDWDKVCGRLYFQAEGGGGHSEYGVLEIYNDEADSPQGGNKRLGRLELDERGFPILGPEEKIFHETTVLLKKSGSQIDKEKDRFAIWIAKPTSVMGGWPDSLRLDTAPNIYAVGDWDQEASTPPEEISAERPVPKTLRGWVSKVIDKPQIVVRTEDPDQAITVYPKDAANYVMRSGANYWGLVPGAERTSGEKFATMEIYICTKDEFVRSTMGANEYGRKYALELYWAWSERALAKAELMKEDGTEVLATATPETAEGEETARVRLTTAEKRVWVRLTCGPLSGETEAPREGKPRIFLFRKNADGVLTTETDKLIPCYPEKAGGGGAELTLPGQDQHESCWVQLAVPEAGAEYLVLVTDATGLQDENGTEYILELKRPQTEEGETNETQ